MSQFKTLPDALPKPLLHSGMAYVHENIHRALLDLIDPNTPYRQRILNACFNAHRPGKYEGTLEAMSGETIRCWHQCDPKHFNKPFDELSDSEVESIAQYLVHYLTFASTDLGIAAAGQEPCFYDGTTPLTVYSDGQEALERRNKMAESYDSAEAFKEDV